VAGALFALLIGAALAVVSIDQRLFARFFGPALRSQYAVERRITPWRRRTYETMYVRTRICVVVFSALVLAASVVALVTRLA
jgi:hypothetical protein